MPFNNLIVFKNLQMLKKIIFISYETALSRIFVETFFSYLSVKQSVKLWKWNALKNLHFFAEAYSCIVHGYRRQSYKIY
jgi:hypothetical protein